MNAPFTPQSKTSVQRKPGSDLPKMIALCGNPLAGKSTAAELICEMFDYEIVDDGLPLRQIAMKYMGLTEHQVFTHSGKLEEITLNGRKWTCREVLGEIGNAFEEKFGGDIIPIMSHMILKPDTRVVFGSVRRDQGIYWRNAGALVIEIANPSAGPSNYEFDRFNREPVHATIVNDGLFKGMSEDDALLDLCAKLKIAIGA